MRHHDQIQTQFHHPGLQMYYLHHHQQRHPIHRLQVQMQSQKRLHRQCRLHPHLSQSQLCFRPAQLRLHWIRQLVLARLPHPGVQKRLASLSKADLQRLEQPLARQCRNLNRLMHLIRLRHPPPHPRSSQWFPCHRLRFVLLYLSALRCVVLGHDDDVF